VPLYLYTALRTKKARKLREATCKQVRSVAIDESGMLLLDGLAVIERADRNAFAIDDGFGSWDELVDYWQTEHGRELPWHGTLCSPSSLERPSRP
jgi:hypothetical protein